MWYPPVRVDQATLKYWFRLSTTWNTDRSFGNLKDFEGPKTWYMPTVSVSALSFPSFNKKILPPQHMGINQFAAHPVAWKGYVHDPRICQMWRLGFPVITSDGFHLRRILVQSQWILAKPTMDFVTMWVPCLPSLSPPEGPVSIRFTTGLTGHSQDLFPFFLFWDNWSSLKKESCRAEPTKLRQRGSKKPHRPFTHLWLFLYLPYSYNFETICWITYINSGIIL